MKTVLSLRLSGLVLLALAGCKPETNTAADEARRQLEATQATYAQQADDMKSRSEDLQKQLAELQRSIQDKENAELKAKLDAISAENQKLMADAEAARRKSEQLREQLASNSVMPPPVPVAMPYVPPMAQSPVSQSWNDPDADYSMFYNSLSPHGRWLQVDGYGYAFRPKLSERSSWRPYVDGRWVSTSQGWAWDSREPFGWACYHYGRWVRLSRQGWVWVPGREWAPAWVSWRSGGSHVGWAPLPPTAGYGNIIHDCDARYGLAPSSYTFIQASHFGRPSYVNATLPTSSVTQIFNQTINVTNIVQVRQQNTNIFMHRGGPALDWVERCNGSPIAHAPVQIARSLERPNEFHPGHAGAPSFIAAPMPSGRSGHLHEIPKNAEHVSKPIMTDAWKEVPSAQRDALREAITRQARGPQPQPVLAASAPEVPAITPTPERIRETPVQPEVSPAIPAPNMPVTPGQIAGHDRGNHQPPVMPKLEITQDAANKAASARLDAERQTQEAEEARQKHLAEQKAAETAMIARQQELAGKQAEAAAMREQLAEQEKKDLALRDKKAADMSEKEAAELKEKQAAEMAAQQQELARKEAEAVAMRQQLAEQEKKNQAMREEQSAAMKLREAELEKAKTAAEMAAQQQELARKQEESVAMAQRQEAIAAQAEAAKQQEMQAEGRKQAEMEASKARESAMAQQQEALKAAAAEAAERQRAALVEQQQEAAAKAQQEATMRAQQEAQQRAQQEAAERQRAALMEQQQEAAAKAQQEAAMRAQQEAQQRAQQESAERQREAAERAQQEAMRQQQQEAARRAQEEAARRAAEEAARQQQEAAQRAAEEAARRAAQPPGQP
jgi:hypothetical protein